MQNQIETMPTKKDIIQCLIEKSEPLNRTELCKSLYGANTFRTAGAEERQKMVKRLAVQLHSLCKQKELVRIPPEYGFTGTYVLPGWIRNEKLKARYQKKPQRKAPKKALTAQTIISVAIIDDMPLSRGGLKALLSTLGGVEVVIEAPNRSAFLQTNGPAPDVCILSSQAFFADHTETFADLKSKYGDMKILILASWYHEFALHKAVNDGADGYLTRKCSPQELKKAVQAVWKGQKYYGGIPTDALMSEIYQGSNKTSISPKHLQFLSWCVENFSYEQIGAEMGVTRRGVEGYRDKLFEIFGSNHKHYLCLCAIKCGLVEFK